MNVEYISKQRKLGSQESKDMYFIKCDIYWWHCDWKELLAFYYLFSSSSIFTHVKVIGIMRLRDRAFLLLWDRSMELLVLPIFLVAFQLFALTALHAFAVFLLRRDLRIRGFISNQRFSGLCRKNWYVGSTATSGQSPLQCRTSCSYCNQTSLTLQKIISL